MKADQYGTPAEQTRHQADWRTAEKNGPRCDGCIHVELIPNGNGKWAAHCTALELATKPNATCDHHEPIRIGGPQPQQERDDMAISDSKPTGKAPSVSAGPWDGFGERPHPEEWDTERVEDSGNLPTVTEMMAAAEPDEDDGPAQPFEAENLTIDTLQASALIAQRSGRRQALDAIQKLITVSNILDLQRIKEGKLYKGSVVSVDGKFVTLRTWGQFCELVEGRPRATVDLDLLNLKAFGPEFFDSMQKIGIGPGTMRSLRQIPEDERSELEKAAREANRDEFLELAETLITKHAKEKAELTKKLDDSERALSASRERVERLRQRVEEHEDAEHARSLNPPPPDEEAAQLRDALTRFMHQQKAALMTSGRRGIMELLFHGEKHGEDHKVFIAGLLCEWERELNILRADFGIDDKPDANPVPEWMRPDFEPGQ
jgi:hypothetical protein